MLPATAAAGGQLRIRICGREDGEDQPQAEHAQQQGCKYAPQTAIILRI